MWIIGHRGSAGMHPENTLSAIDAALTAGADGIEIDIREVGGALVVLHDENLDRTTNGYGSLYERTLAELRTLDAGDGQQIPLLEEVLSAVDARVGLNIEIKQSDIVPTLLSLLEKTVTEQEAWRPRLLISSFENEVMRELALRCGKQYKLGVLHHDGATAALNLANEIDAYSVNLSLHQLRRVPDIVAEAHARARKVLVYTVNELGDVSFCENLKVDGIFTDFPARTIAFLRD